MRPSTRFASVIVGSVPPGSVADRSGIRSGTLGPDTEQVTAVHPRDRTAAGADLHQVDHRRPKRIPSSFSPMTTGTGIGSHLVLLRDLRHTALDQPDLRGRSTHVERQQIRLVELAAEIAGSNYPCRRSRLHHVDRFLGAGREGVNPAAALHEQERSGHLLLPQARFDSFQVTSDNGPDPGVDDGCARPKVFAEVGRDFAGE